MGPWRRAGSEGGLQRAAAGRDAARFRGGEKRQLVCGDRDRDGAPNPPPPRGLKVEEASPKCRVCFLRVEK